VSLVVGADDDDAAPLAEAAQTPPPLLLAAPGPDAEPDDAEDGAVPPLADATLTTRSPNKSARLRLYPFCKHRYAREALCVAWGTRHNCGLLKRVLRPTSQHVSTPKCVRSALHSHCIKTCLTHVRIMHDICCPPRFACSR
jgi:hypothetical protein